jgi:hypothetical protein
MHGNRGKIRQCTLVPAFTKISRSPEGKVTIVWNQQVQTDRTIPNNKPDIIIHDNEKGTYITNSCCNFRRQRCDKKKKALMILQYKDLATEMQRERERERERESCVCVCVCVCGMLKQE